MKSAVAQGPPPAVRPADARLRARRLGQHGRRVERPPPRSSSSRRPVAAVIDVFADRATFALQDEPRGTGDAVAGGPGRRAGRRGRGPRPVRRRAARDRRRPRRRPRGAPPGRRRDRARQRLRRRPGRARAGRPGRVRDGRAHRRGEGRDARTSSPATRSTPGSTPSMPTGCGAGSGPWRRRRRPASCT